jgi:hypothetical protein
VATIKTAYGVVGAQPVAQHEGTNGLRVRISFSVSLSLGDIHQVAKLPHGAIPLDVVFYPGGSLAAANAAFKIGTSASHEAFFLSATHTIATFEKRISATKLNAFTQLSLSDDVMPRYEHVVFVGSAGMSIGHIGDLVLYYAMPQQTVP